jgi:hypothetical protein
MPATKKKTASAQKKPARKNLNISACENTLLSLEGAADTLLERFVVSLESGKGFAAAMEKIEEQLDSAKRKQAARSELDLNEANVISEKIAEELAAMGRMAQGASLLRAEEKWSGNFESVRASLDRLSSHVRKMKSNAHHAGEGAMDAGSALAAFHSEADVCIGKLDLLSEAFEKKGAAHARVSAAKRKAELLKASIGKAFAALSKDRLRKKVEEAKAEICAFMRKNESGRIFVDHKHLTLTSGGHKMRVPLTQQVRFSLEEMAPIEKEMSKLGKAVIVGSFESQGTGLMLRIGERAAVGDTVVYKEKSYFCA